jgi:hypothetical protein
VEEGRFGNFTNSIVVIYWRLRLNECPGLTNFVCHQLPDEIQVDSVVGPGAAAVAKQESALDNSRSRESPDILAESINNCQSKESGQWLEGNAHEHNRISP